MELITLILIFCEIYKTLHLCESTHLRQPLSHRTTPASNSVLYCSQDKLNSQGVGMCTPFHPVARENSSVFCYMMALPHLCYVLAF